MKITGTRKYIVLRTNIHWTVRLRLLACLKMPIHAHLFRRAILTREVDQIGLVFGMQPEFVSVFVCAKLQVSVCSGYDLCHPG